MNTLKLYDHDAYSAEFNAIITGIRPHSDGYFAITLDQTAFYPASGGQPSDTGWINDTAVVDVIEDNSDILHLVAEVPDGDKVTGRINWSRRFDHMQQHSGQHILSAAAHQVTGAETAGFHLGAESSQIDLTLDALTREQTQQIERLANEVVFANLLLDIHHATRDNLSNYPVRKQPPTDVEQIRLIEVPGIDCCPCGGTHVKQTGEIGLIKIRSWERKKGLVRIDFVCGTRALRDYQLVTYAINDTAARFSAPIPELLATVERHFARDEQLEKQLYLLKQTINEYLAKELQAASQTVNGIKVISQLLPSATPQDVSELAKRLTVHGQTVALIGGINPEQTKNHLVFSCSPGIKINMNEQLKAVLPRIKGKGGGNPQTAQGGGSEITETASVLAEAKQNILAAL